MTRATSTPSQSIYAPSIVVRRRRSGSRYVWVNDRLLSVNNAIIMMSGVIWAIKHPLKSPILEEREKVNYELLD